jgi:peptidoglycan hydrolase CwlO-like protein
MAAASDSQGLKIAVAVFVTLAVVLAVSTYFAYTSYTQADAKFTKAEADSQAAKKEAMNRTAEFDALRKEVGVKAEDPEAVKAEIKNERKKIDDALNAMAAQVKEVVTKARASGAQGEELDAAMTKVDAITAAYRAEPNQTYISSLARMSDLLHNLSMLTTQVALNYVDVKRNLESSDTVNAQKLDVATKALDESKKDLASEHDQHKNERETILAKIDQYTSENAKLTSEIENLRARIRKMEDDSAKSLAVAQQTIREQRDRLERKEQVLDRPDGQVTFVDYNRGEVHTNVTRGTGARPQMQFAIFDAQSPGLPTDRPKGTVELVQVGDRASVARIIKTNSNIDPIRVGDYVYSAAWSPNEPMRFALIGKIDMNRDGVDDRQDLKRMIEAAGGIVDYDLPPPEVGKESGKLTGRDAWYVVDDPKERPPFREVYAKTNVTAQENIDFLKKQTEAVREARLNGVRPMPIERLLTYLGYDMLAPVRGRAEAVDTQSLKRLLMPRQNPDRPKAAEPKAEEPAKEEAPKDESK